MKYAIIKFAGKQIKVSEGDVFSVEKQEDPLNISVLLFKDDKNLMIGKPVLEDVEVKATIVKDYKGNKIRVSRFRSKSRYRRERTHRQPLTDVKIEKIGMKSKTTVAKTTQKVADKSEDKTKEETTTKVKKVKSESPKAKEVKKKKTTKKTEIKDKKEKTEKKTKSAKKEVKTSRKTEKAPKK
jgi:large subunit ribosomal protein L21